MFHEVWYPIRRNHRYGHNLLRVVTRIMAFDARGISAPRFWSQPGMGAALRKLDGFRYRATFPVVTDLAGVDAIRSRLASGRVLLGHFGTYTDRW